MLHYSRVNKTSFNVGRSGDTGFAEGRERKSKRVPRKLRTRSGSGGLPVVEATGILFHISDFLQLFAIELKTLCLYPFHSHTNFCIYTLFVVFAENV